MKHQNPMITKRKSTPVARDKLEHMRNNQAHLLSLAKKACDKFGGCAEIGEGYYIINTEDYTIVEREQK